jgi:hypothetical protein
VFAEDAKVGGNLLPENLRRKLFHKLKLYSRSHHPFEELGSSLPKRLIGRLEGWQEMAPK